MSRVTYFDENEEEKEIILNLDECRYKVNGKCYNNYGDYIRLGKRCFCRCTHFLEEDNIK